MLPHWKHLALEQRAEIAHGLAHDEPLRSIAEKIEMDPASVSKEIKRNRTMVAQAIEEFAKGQAKPRPGNGLNPWKGTLAPVFGLRGKAADSASSEGQSRFAWPQTEIKLGNPLIFRKRTLH